MIKLLADPLLGCCGSGGSMVFPKKALWACDPTSSK